MRSKQDALMAEVAKTHRNPLLFTQAMYPWEVKGTPLARHEGPDDWQVKVLEHMRHCMLRDKPIRIAVASGHGVGKAQAYDDVVPTPSGERRWGELQPGDELFGSDGRPTRITETHHFANMPMFRVSFDDGSHLDVSSGHLWAVRGRQDRRYGLDGYRVMETLELFEAGVKRANGVAEARQWALPPIAPVEFKMRPVPLFGYFIGVWLGDGRWDSPRFSSGDPEIAEELCRLGMDVSKGAGPFDYNVRGALEAMRSLGLLRSRTHEKAVPRDYLYNTMATRLSVLQGLMDTDGTVTNGGTPTFSSTSRRLVEDVVWLTRSLGGKATIMPTPKQPFYYDGDGTRVDGRTCYNAVVRLPEGVPTFQLQRKQALVKAQIEDRYRQRWIDRIEPIGNADGMCVTVEAEDSLYLARSFIPTHNSAEMAWLSQWFMATRGPRLQLNVTANTRGQLTTKTWRELARWHDMSMVRNWFKWTATKYYGVGSPATWSANAIPWSRENSEAFAGTHEEGEGGAVMLQFDEASAIDDVIWEVAEGAMTTKGAMWIVFGNPTRNTGRFRECFPGGEFAHRWFHLNVDSRTAKMADKRQLDEWIEDYGEDSDFARVRIKGEFPRAANNQFIPSDIVDAGVARRLSEGDYRDEPRILSCDVARFGDDQTVIGKRQGGKLFPLLKYRGLDTMAVARRVSDVAGAWGPDAIFVDGIGIGAGVVDRLRQLNHRVFDVQAGAKADDQTKYYNKRAEMWGCMKDWLAGDVDLPEDKELRAHLIGIEYGLSAAKGQLQLEQKKDMKRRGLESPDCGDALALGFAESVRHQAIRGELANLRVGRRPPSWRVA